MSQKSKRIYLALILLISLVGGGIAAYTTRNGPWGYTDSVSYLATARNIANGTGVGYYEADAAFSFATIQPFFYPLVISPFALAGADVVATARWLGVAAFMLVIFLGGWLFVRSGRNPSLGVAVSALLCIFPHMVLMACSAMTEPLFLLLLLASGAAMLAYFSNGKSRWLVLGALLTGLLPVTKYVGVACLLSGALSVLFLAEGKFWKRVGQTALFSALAVLPIVAWLGWVYVVEGHSVAGRAFDLRLAAENFGNFRGIFTETVWKWLPFQESGKMFRYLVKLALMALTVLGAPLAAYFALKRIRQTDRTNAASPDNRIFVFFGLAALSFVLVFAATHAFTFPTPDINNRTLIPLYVSTGMSLAGAFSLVLSAWGVKKLRFLHLLPWLALTVSLFSYVPRTLAVVNYYLPGDGLTAYAWDRSETIEAVRALPEGTPVISNDWELLMLWADRPVYGLWNTFPQDGSQTTAYGTNPADRAQTIFCAEGAVLVIFGDFDSQVRKTIGEAYLPQLPALFGSLSVHGEYMDGMIYTCP